MQEVTGHTSTGKLWKGFRFGAGRHGNDDMIRFIFLKDDSGCHSETGLEQVQSGDGFDMTSEGFLNSTYLAGCCKNL